MSSYFLTSTVCNHSTATSYDSDGEIIQVCDDCGSKLWSA